MKCGRPTPDYTDLNIRQPICSRFETLNKPRIQCSPRPGISTENVKSYFPNASLFYSTPVYFFLLSRDADYYIIHLVVLRSLKMFSILIHTLVTRECVTCRSCSCFKFLKVMSNRSAVHLFCLRLWFNTLLMYKRADYRIRSKLSVTACESYVIPFSMLAHSDS